MIGPALLIGLFVFMLTLSALLPLARPKCEHTWMRWNINTDRYHCLKCNESFGSIVDFSADKS